MLTLQQARELFVADYETGELFYRTANGVKPVRTTGTHYKAVTVNGKTIYQHRIIFLLYHGHYPYGETDHIDENKRNNRISNLRDISHSENMKNISHIHCQRPPPKRKP